MKEEKIEVASEDVDKEASDLASKYNMKKEEFLNLFGGLEMVEYDMKMRKAIEILKRKQLVFFLIKMNPVCTFIDFIKNLTDDDYGHNISYFSSKLYFKSGGCYELVKTLKYFLPDSEIYVRNDYGHCTFKV